MTAIPEEAANAVRQVVADAYARQTREIRWADVSHIAQAATEEAAPIIVAGALREAADTITDLARDDSNPDQCELGYAGGLCAAATRLHALAAALSHTTDRSELTR